MAFSHSGRPIEKPGFSTVGDHHFLRRETFPTACSPHEDVLMNVEAFRGAIRKGQWKLIKVAALPGKTELYDVVQDPSEKENVAEKNPEVVKDLEARLLGYAKQKKMSEWLKSQVDFLGFQGETFLDPGYSTDGGLPTEKPVLPEK